MADLMIVEIFDGEKWEEGLGDPFGGVKTGSTFRLRDPNTREFFVGDNGKTEFVATDDPYLNDVGIWTVNIRK